VTWGDTRYASSVPSAVVGAQDDAIQILRSRIDLSGLPALTRAVTEQVICASGDVGYADDLVCSEDWLRLAVAALAEGAPVIADGPMVAAGITGCVAVCKADQPLTTRLARTAGIPMAAAAVRLALGEAGQGAIWVVGSEPVALEEILRRGAEPGLVIGLPAGLAGAADAKRALRASGLPAVTNVGEKGGPAVAAAACMALLREALAPASGPEDGQAPGAAVMPRPAS
jgi:precorrin-8X/cobalt-precorrin-8 methylmutase